MAARRPSSPPPSSSLRADDEEKRKKRSASDSAAEEEEKKKKKKMRSKEEETTTIDEGEILPRVVDKDGRNEKENARNNALSSSKTNGRAGGAYVPPFKLAQMLREIRDKSSPEYQRITWEALKKSINGLVNKINSSNVKNIVPELFSENLVRGKGLFARSVMKSQMASPQFSPVFAALVAVTNTKFPELGELVVKRVVLQFRRAFKRNDKSVCVAATKFLASLVNQQVRVCGSFFLFPFSSRRGLLRLVFLFAFYTNARAWAWAI
jgi:pre-mRNA-splicing factor CWC22